MSPPLRKNKIYLSLQINEISTNTKKSLVNRRILCYYAKANANGILYALMVKRLRRRPLTAESRVRFPMGVPFTDNTTRFEWCCLCVRNIEQALAIGRCFGHKTSLEEVYSVNGTLAHGRVRGALACKCIPYTTCFSKRLRLGGASHCPINRQICKRVIQYIQHYIRGEKWR